MNDILVKEVLKKSNELFIIYDQNDNVIASSPKGKRFLNAWEKEKQQPLKLYQEVQSKGKIIRKFNKRNITFSKLEGTPYIIAYEGEEKTCVLKEKLEYTFLHDLNTNLLNYEGFVDAINKQENIKNAICFSIDIDSFSSIITYYGEKISREVVGLISTALQEYVQRGHIVGCLYGDKFVILLLNPSKEDEEYAFEHMNLLTLRYYHLHNKLVQVKTNIGYARYPEDASSLLQLLPLANLARKSLSIINKVIKYEPTMSKDINKNIDMALRLQEAIQNDKIDVYFQKIIDSKSCAFKYVEALARWEDPELGNISPEEFFLVATKLHLIEFLDDYLIRRTIEDYSKLRMNSLFSNTQLTINVSPTSFFRAGYASYICGLAEMHNLDCRDIIIEISEKTFMNNKELYKFSIATYREKGLKIAIDDFGKDYSSLSLLDGIDYDIIKIDGDFVQNIRSPKNKIIIEMVVKIANLSDKLVIAEGVESEEIAMILKNMQCFYHQGYYYHHPQKLNF